MCCVKCIFLDLHCCAHYISIYISSNPYSKKSPVATNLATQTVASTNTTQTRMRPVQSGTLIGTVNRRHTCRSFSWQPQSSRGNSWRRWTKNIYKLRQSRIKPGPFITFAEPLDGEWSNLLDHHHQRFWDFIRVMDLCGKFCFFSRF